MHSPGARGREGESDRPRRARFQRGAEPCRPLRRCACQRDGQESDETSIGVPDPPTHDQEAVLRPALAVCLSLHPAKARAAVRVRSGAGGAADGEWGTAVPGRSNGSSLDSGPGVLTPGQAPGLRCDYRRDFVGSRPAAELGRVECASSGPVVAAGRTRRAWAAGTARCTRRSRRPGRRPGSRGAPRTPSRCVAGNRHSGSHTSRRTSC
jgi:hypothetical protein